MYKSGTALGVSSFYSDDPGVIIIAFCLDTLAARHVTGRLTCLTPLNHSHVQYQSSTEESTVEKPAETQTSICLASHLVRATNSRSGGHELESPMWREFGALTKTGKTLGVRSFYNNYFLVSRPRWTFFTLL